MTLAEKVGQLCQVQPHGRNQEERVRAGTVGSLINVVGDDAYHYQWLALEHSRLRIPLLIGRDVIHGFNTIAPIPLAQAASFDPAAVRDAAALAAREAAAAGVNWTFSPMLDIARDPRWGRMAESAGEDPLLASRIGAAMVEGYQGEGLAACAKHFVGYGAAEGGRDYSESHIPPRQLRDIHLPPFKAAVDAGVMTVMAAFHEIDGLPSTGNPALLRGVLKDEWGFDGLVVSDWDSVIEMRVHGFAEDAADCARKALGAGVDMEMASHSFIDHLPALLDSGAVGQAELDDAVRRILRIKARLGLFENPYGRQREPQDPQQAALQARALARRSCVLLKNDALLPLDPAPGPVLEAAPGPAPDPELDPALPRAQGPSPDPARDPAPVLATVPATVPATVHATVPAPGRPLGRLAVIGPLADAGHDQLGCWVFDADPGRTRSVLAGIRERLGEARVLFEPGLAHCRSHDEQGFDAAERAARAADAVLLCLGEDAGLSGEAHCRAFIELPGAQQRLLDRIAATGVPVIVVLLAGRALALAPVVEKAGALLLAWHPGSLGGPAIADLLFGESPSGRLPVSLPRSVGQVPLYYNHKNTGRPPDPDAPSIPSGTPLDPKGFFAAYLDEDHRPLFPFGFGLSYARFDYANLLLSSERVAPGGVLSVSVLLSNSGRHAGTEVVQLYVRDLVGSVTRPVKELKDFQRVHLEAGESCLVRFQLPMAALAFHGIDLRPRVEPGRFRLWVGPHSASGLAAEFELLAD